MALAENQAQCDETPPPTTREQCAFPSAAGSEACYLGEAIELSDKSPSVGRVVTARRADCKPEPSWRGSACVTDAVCAREQSLHPRREALPFCADRLCGTATSMSLEGQPPHHTKVWWESSARLKENAWHFERVLISRFRDSPDAFIAAAAATRLGWSARSLAPPRSCRQKRRRRAAC